MKKVEFKTQHIPLAVTLLFCGYKIKKDGIKICDLARGTKEIEFEPSAYIEKTAEDYWDGKITVEPKAFLECRTELMKKMFG